MATNQDFVQYIADQMSRAGEITYRKMFGEYGLYCNGMFFALTCDDKLFVKPTEAGKAILGAPVMRPPYMGSKDWFYIENVDDHELLTALAKATFAAVLTVSSSR